MNFCETSTQLIEKQLINLLLSGGIEPCNFRLKINDFPKTRVKNLFHDSFPKFTSSLKTNFTNTFTKYFFNNKEISINEFWKFVDHKDFWVQIRRFHDFVYSREMNYNRILKYFERCLVKKSSKLNLSYLEQRIIEKVDENPYALYKEIAKKLNVSEKTVSTTIQNLRSRGIFLGSVASYCSVDSYEFFSFNFNKNLKEKSLFIDEFHLFPRFKILYGVLLQKSSNSSIYYVQEKQSFLNSNVLNMGVSIKDWKKHSIQKFSDKLINDEDNKQCFPLTSANKNYILRLMRNCELDYRRPEIKQISKDYEISIRTLFRVKSKLKDMGVIKPKIIVDSDELMNLLLITKRELVDLYNKIPYIKTYRVLDNNDNTLWFSFASIFVSDFHFLYTLVNNKAELFQIINKKSIDLSKHLDTSIMHSKHKVYTK
jgi:DNA-binding Lrp family transcriptional regulator